MSPQIITSTLAPDQEAEVFDLTLRRGPRGWPPGMRVQPFLEDEALVLGAPALFAQRPVAHPGALSAHVLLSKSHSKDWESWKK